MNGIHCGVRASRDDVERYRRAGTWREVTVLDDLGRWARDTPGATALIAQCGQAEPEAIAYRDLAERVEACASYLASLGVGPGGVVSARLPNCWQAVVLALATWMRGAVWAPIMPTIGRRELNLMLARLGPRVFFSTSPADSDVAVAAVNPLTTVICPRGGPERAGVGHVGYAAASSVGGQHIDPDCAAVVLFTSGTTGQPKAALKSLNNVYANIVPLLDELSDLPSPHAIYTPQSLMHAAALSMQVKSIVAGSALLICEQWNPRRAAQLIATVDARQIIIVPRYLEELLDELETRADYDQGGQRREVLIAGTAFHPRLVERARRCGLSARSMWGMTEGGIMLSAPDTAGRCLGWPGRGTEVSLGSLDSDDLLPNTSFQELRITGASLCLATAGRDRGDVELVTAHNNGWYGTGDLVTFDQSLGYCLQSRVADRIGEAFMIPIADVEGALMDHDHIDDVVVVGHRDNTEGCAVVVANKPLTLSDLHAHLAALNMTTWFWPTALELVEELPRNAMGNVDRAGLRRQLANRA